MKNNPQSFIDRLYVWRRVEKGGSQNDSHMFSLRNNQIVVTFADREYGKKTHLEQNGGNDGFSLENYIAKIPLDSIMAVILDAERLRPNVYLCVTNLQTIELVSVDKINREDKSMEKIIWLRYQEKQDPMREAEKKSQ